MSRRRLSVAFWTSIAAVIALGACSELRDAKTSSDPELELKRELLRRMPSGSNLLYIGIGGAGVGAVTTNDAALAWISDDVFERVHLKGVYWAYVASGATVSLSAAPSSGSTFAGWYGSTCSGTGPCQFVMNGNVDVGAQFGNVPPAARTSYTLQVKVLGYVDGQISATASPVPPGGLEWGCTAFDQEDRVNTRRTCLATAPPGTEITLSAMPLPGTYFQGWGASCTGSGACVVTMDRDLSITAMFARTQEQPPTPPTFTVGGSVTGLAGTGLVLRNNGVDDLPVLTSGPFSFSTRLPGGAAYAVTVALQPTNPAQTCTVADASGTVGASNVSSVSVTCVTETYPVDVTVSGLAGAGLVLSNSLDGGPREQLAIPGNGTYTFPTRGSAGAVYSVAVTTRPSGPPQICDVIGGTGVLGGASASVEVSCRTVISRLTVTPTGVIGSGLTFAAMGSTVTFDPHTMDQYLFFRPAGTPYDVQILQQPVSPWQTCTVTNGVGVLAEFGSFVDIGCTTNAYTIGGAISGLTGSGLVLAIAGEPNLSVPAGATSFTFPNALASGSSYDVFVLAQPTSPSQTCTVASGIGTVEGNNVTTIGVNCTTNRYRVGGSVTGLAGSGLVLALAGEQNLTIPAGATSFTFSNTRASGASYSVSVLTQPTNPWQTCSVANGSGTVVAGDVADVAVTCTTNRYQLGGTVSGLVGSGLVLATAGEPDLSVSPSATGFMFANGLASGSSYAVSVVSQPTSPSQTCTVANGIGTVAGGSVTGIAVTCCLSRDYCGEACVDTQTDPNHCGGCGVVCRFGDVCNAGACAASACPGRTVLVPAGPTREGASLAYSVALSDLDRDGTLDVVTANPGSNTVSVLLGTGDGTFGTAISYPVGSLPLSAAIADVNGDGVPDVVTANNHWEFGVCGWGGSVSVLLGNGDGTLGASVPYATPGSSRSIAVADFNRDGRPDLVTAMCGGPMTVAILLGNGDGTFSAATNWAAGMWPWSVAVGDLDKNGNLDLVVANDYQNHLNASTVSVLIGNGDGTFRAPVGYGTTRNLNTVAIGDLNRDGLADVVAASTNTYVANVFLGKGDGTLVAAQPGTVVISSDPASVAIGDLDNDGIPDLVTANYYYAGTITIAFGRGDGTFSTQSTFAFGSRPHPFQLGDHAVALGDLDSDGRTDAVLATAQGVYALLGKCQP